METELGVIVMNFCLYRNVRKDVFVLFKYIHNMNLHKLLHTYSEEAALCSGETEFTHLFKPAYCKAVAHTLKVENSR